MELLGHDEITPEYPEIHRGGDPGRKPYEDPSGGAAF